MGETAVRPAAYPDLLRAPECLVSKIPNGGLGLTSGSALANAKIWQDSRCYCGSACQLRVEKHGLT